MCALETFNLDSAENTRLTRDIDNGKKSIGVIGPVQQRPRQRNEHVTASRRNVTRCDTRASNPSSVRITRTSVARRIHPQRIRNDRVSHMSRVSRAA